MALDTEVPTPDGWMRTTEIRTGQLVFDMAGRTTRVTAWSPGSKAEPCFEVVFRDGPSIIATAEHSWPTRLAASAALPRNRTTEEMYADGRRMMVPRALPWDLPERSYDIDPYILGLWLGDGDKNNATITASHDDAPGTADRIEACGYTATFSSISGKRSPVLYVSIPGSRRNQYSPVRGLKVRLRDAELLGNKRIPAGYLRGSAEQRLALLQGLMDTDGSVSKTGACCFVNSIRPIVDGVLELLRSLGENPVETWVRDDRSRTGGYWKVTFTPRNCVPFQMPRKVGRCRPDRGGTGDRWVGVKEIRPVEPAALPNFGLAALEATIVAGRGGHVTYSR